MQADRLSMQKMPQELSIRAPLRFECRLNARADQISQLSYLKDTSTRVPFLLVGVLLVATDRKIMRDQPSSPLSVASVALRLCLCSRLQLECSCTNGEAKSVEASGRSRCERLERRSIKMVS
jgi:hypothetical protein